MRQVYRNLSISVIPSIEGGLNNHSAPPLHKVQDFQKSFLEMMRADHQKDVLDVLSSGVINDDVTAIIEKVAADTAQPFKVNE